MAVANRLWRGTAPLGLASKSAARRDLLSAAGLPFETVAVTVDERALETSARQDGAGAEQIAVALARAKALAGADVRPDLLVIGADQTLSLDDTLFHKPADREGARAQLEALAGRTHALHAAVALARGPTVLFETVETARLTMRPLPSASLEAYLDSAGAAVQESVGGYQLEGLGVHLFERIAGEHAVILGLPMLQLLDFLRRHGVLL